MVEPDRRRFQRMKLARPILAAVDNGSALILDIGLGGALVEHHGTVKTGDEMTLRFRWQGEEISFPCEVTRSTDTRAEEEGGKQTSETAVAFVNPPTRSVVKLEDMMATFVGRVLAAQRANANANDSEPTAILFQLGEARRSRSRGYVAYLFDGKSWVRRPSRLADQPRNGFTVAAYEDEEELETLCRAYESADEEGRRLIRLVAELSANSVPK
jgi:PilZ domain-containing protein